MALNTQQCVIEREMYLYETESEHGETDEETVDDEQSIHESEHGEEIEDEDYDDECGEETADEDEKEDEVMGDDDEGNVENTDNRIDKVDERNQQVNEKLPGAAINMESTQQDQKVKNLLNTLFKFQPGSKLKSFLVKKTRVEKTYYTLVEILIILKDIIRGEGLFDDTNPSIILCDKELEEALDKKALHVTEIRDVVLKELIKISDQNLRDGFPQSKKISSDGSTNRVTTSEDTLQNKPLYQRVMSVFTDGNTRFSVKPKLLSVIRIVPETDQTKSIFTYKEVMVLISKYILARKDEIFDARNIKVALVETDPIGAALGVKSFHRCQINNLIRSQLTIPLENSRCEKDIAHEATQTDD